MNFFELDEIRDNHRQLTEERQSQIEELNTKLFEELKSRKFEELTTDQLIKLILLTNKQLDGQTMLIARKL